MRKSTIFIGVLAAAALAGSAAADKYGELTAKAQKAAPADVAGLFWSATVDCGKTSNDLEKRQCEGVRAARADAASDGTYVAPGDAAAFEVGEWDATKGGLPLTVYGCIACTSPVDVGGGQVRYLVTKGDVKIAGGAVRGPVVHKAVRKFKTQEDAKRWKDTVVPRLRVQFVFTLPSRPAEWTAEGAKGFAVEMQGFRVYDPCDGAMVCANPPSDGEKADKAMCKGGSPSGTDLQETKPVDKPVDKPVEPEIADSLSSNDIDRSMKKTREKVHACFSNYGVPGKADITLQIGTDGKVKKVELRGEFKDTPTGECITNAVKESEFPPFREGPMTIKYPFILR